MRKMITLTLPVSDELNALRRLNGSRRHYPESLYSKVIVVGVFVATVAFLTAMKFFRR